MGASGAASFVTAPPILPVAPSNDCDPDFQDIATSPAPFASSRRLYGPSLAICPPTAVDGLNVDPLALVKDVRACTSDPSMLVNATMACPFDAMSASTSGVKLLNTALI